uniref:Ig-like domain-containing protein n=1 Tax=Myripristis murdjan TaxID=586833 RepID=A0A667XWH5_9TELE
MDASRSCDRIWLLLVFVTAASCQQSVSSVVGQHVLLPCAYEPADKLPPRVNVFWRWGDDVNVYNIVQNVQHLQNQAPRFRNRVSSFPELYRTGNFSLLLQKVTLNDSGSYSCHVPAENFRQNVQLDVQLTGEENKTTGGGAAGNRIGNKSGSIGIRLNHLTLLVFLLLERSNRSEGLQEPMRSFWQSNTSLCISLGLNALLLLGLLFSVCGQVIGCHHHGNNISAVTPEAAEMQNGPQYEEIYLTKMMYGRRNLFEPEDTHLRLH